MRSLAMPCFSHTLAAKVSRGQSSSPANTVTAIFSTAVMNNLLNLMGVPPFLREAFKGFIVIAAVLLQKKEAAA